MKKAIIALIGIVCVLIITFFVVNALTIESQATKGIPGSGTSTTGLKGTLDEIDGAPDICAPPVSDC